MVSFQNVLLFIHLGPKHSNQQSRQFQTEHYSWCYLYISNVKKSTIKKTNAAQFVIFFFVFIFSVLKKYWISPALTIIGYNVILPEKRNKSTGQYKTFIKKKKCF